MTHTPSFLHNTESPGALRMHRMRRFLKVLCAALAFGILTWALVIIFVTVQTARTVVEAEQSLRLAMEVAEELRFEEAHDHVVRAEVLMERIGRGVAILNTARFLPWVGTQTRAAEGMVRASQGMVHAFERLLGIGGDLLRLSGLSEESLREMTQGLSPSVTFDDLPAETKLLLFRRLAASSADFTSAAADIDLARAELATIARHNLLEPIRRVLEPIERRLAETEEALHLAAVATHLLPLYVGTDGERTTLILFLNNDELRPGGGFIGTYGILRMKHGDITSLQTRDVYHLDREASAITTTPPRALQTYGSLAQWFFRDSNWSPDFAESSRQGLNLFAREVSLIPAETRATIPTAEHIDGVIGFTPTFVSELLSLFGPVAVRGQTFTSQNFADKLEYAVEVGYVGEGLPKSQRKEILGDLVEEMKSRLYRLPAARWPALAASVQEGIRTKQLVLYSEDPRGQSVIEQAGWGGRVTRDEGSDMQMLVDANLSSLKSDPVVSRDIHYEIFRNTDGEYVGRTTVRYQHRGTFNWKTTRYRTYARLYVPKGSTLIRAQGNLRNDRLRNPSLAAGTVDVGEELGLTTFGTFTSIEPGETRELVFEYLLAPSVVDEIRSGAYSLHVMKQIGARPYGLTLLLDFDKSVIIASPPEEASEWGDDIYGLNTKLDQDRFFTVGL